MTPHCVINEIRKELLRSITPGLKDRDGTVGTEWLVAFFPNDRMRITKGLSDEIYNTSWADKVDRSDLEMFVRCDFFIEKDEGHYSLNEQAIIDAVDSDFVDLQPKKTAKSIFLSHKTSDEVLAQEVANQLRRVIHDVDVFVSSEPDGIPKGDWLQQVLQKLDNANALVTLITPLSQRSMWVAFEYGYFWGQKDKEDIYILYHPKAAIPSPLNTIQGKSVVSPEELNVFFREISGRFECKYDEHPADLHVIVETANGLNFETAAEREHKAELISQMAGSPNEIALDAVRELRQRGWLTDGSLEGQSFSSANLQRACLEKAMLRGAKLDHSDLREADLTYADLRGADLGGADFQKIAPNSPRAATLWHANLENAILGSVILRGVNFGGAILKGADFREARMRGMLINEDTQFDENTVLPDGSKWTIRTDMEQWTKLKLIH